MRGHSLEPPGDLPAAKVGNVAGDRDELFVAMTFEVEGDNLLSAAALHYANVLWPDARGQHSKLDAKRRQLPYPSDDVVDWLAFCNSVPAGRSDIGNWPAPNAAKAFHAQAGAKVGGYDPEHFRAVSVHRGTKFFQALILGHLTGVWVFVAGMPRASVVRHFDAKPLVVGMDEASAISSARQWRTSAQRDDRDGHLLSPIRGLN
jgi:hypothetical protein